MPLDNYLPKFLHLENKVFKGRNPYEGYQRGFGLFHGDLKERILEDPLYVEASTLANGLTLISSERQMNLFLIVKFFLNRIPFGHIIEFGSYKCGNAFFLAYLVNKLYPGMRVYALDTFEGMPEPSPSCDWHSKGDFSEFSLDQAKELKKAFNLQNIFFIKGLFQDTAKVVLEDAKEICLAHIDSDLYDSVLFSYNAVKEKMVKGGYIIFDDVTAPSCIGATEAMEEALYHRDKKFAEQTTPHFVFRNL